MNERYEDITEAHAQTFRWIYENPDLKFMNWLRKGEGIYWISGKAGCGKSTLMKHLCENPKTRQSLPSDIENICVAGFFFHDRGPHPLLKSQEGLFCAILHRILSRYRKLISVVLPRQFATFSMRTDRIQNGGWQWTLSELKAALRALVNQKALSLRLCLLIDGLDEFSGEHKDIAVLDELARPSSDSVQVQLCLSSRPLLAFENAYSMHRHVRVQDLTAGDIKKYVTDEFNKDVQLKELATNDRVTSDQIMEEILEKAEGVSAHLFRGPLLDVLRGVRAFV
jgi:energy-coupling factor transporter ATP-binding protein EcfA2